MRHSCCFCHTRAASIVHCILVIHMKLLTGKQSCSELPRLFCITPHCHLCYSSCRNVLSKHQLADYIDLLAMLRPCLILTYLPSDARPYNSVRVTSFCIAGSANISELRSEHGACQHELHSPCRCHLQHRHQ